MEKMKKKKQSAKSSLFKAGDYVMITGEGSTCGLYGIAPNMKTDIEKTSIGVVLDVITNDNDAPCKYGYKVRNSQCCFGDIYVWAEDSLVRAEAKTFQKGQKLLVTNDLTQPWILETFEDIIIDKSGVSSYRCTGNKEFKYAIEYVGNEHLAPKK